MSAVLVRTPERADAASMWEIARTTVDENSPYSYLMLVEYFRDTCAVAIDSGTVVGFVTAFHLPADPRTLFVWQVAVDDGHRRRGIAGSLLDHLVGSASPPVCRVEATVTVPNVASAALFRALARRWGGTCEERVLFARTDFPLGAAAGSHDAEILFSIHGIGDHARTHHIEPSITTAGST